MFSGQTNVLVFSFPPPLPTPPKMCPLLQAAC